MKEIKEKIAQNKAEINYIQASKDSMQSMPPDLIKRIKDKIKEIVHKVIEKEHGARMIDNSTSSAIHMLADIEKTIFDHSRKINDLREELNDDVEFSRIERSIWNDRKHAKQEENQRRKEQEAIEKRRKDDMKKKNKVVFRFKPLRFRSEPKRIIRKVEKNQKLTKEEEMKLYYLGFL